MQRIISLIFLITAVMLSATAAKGEIVAADWSTAASGTINDIPFTFSSGNWISSYDLSGTDYSFAPLSDTQEAVDYGCGADWTLEFESTIDGLLLYLVYWRGDFAGIDPVEYTFDSPFSIQSGLSGAAVTGSTLTLPASGNYYSGIIKFSAPLISLNVVSNSASGNMQVLTVAYDDASSSVLQPVLMLLLNKK